MRATLSGAILLLSLVLSAACGPPCPAGTTHTLCEFATGGFTCRRTPSVTICARTVDDAFDQAHAALGPTPAGEVLTCGAAPNRMPPPLHPEDVGAGGGGTCLALGGAGGAGGDGGGGDGFGGSSDIGTGVGASSDVGGVGAGPSSSDVGAGAGPGAAVGAGGGDLRPRGWGGAGGAGGSR